MDNFMRIKPGSKLDELFSGYTKTVFTFDAAVDMYHAPFFVCSISGALVRDQIESCQFTNNVDDLF